MGNIGLFALLVLICSSASHQHPVKRTELVLAGSLLQQCSVNCEEMKPGNVALVPLFCFLLYPAVSISCSEPSTPNPNTTNENGEEGHKGDTVQNIPVNTTFCDPMAPGGDASECKPFDSVQNHTALESLHSIDGNLPLIMEYILKNREFVVLKKLENQTLIRVEEDELKEALTLLSSVF